ncbi:MAG: DUF3466 family protein, partial [Sedimentisphaerales bacterium]|nr:DUF3466 family protein [Sedimentisphaerales bacterium]
MDLGTLGGASSSAWAIKDNGQIVGKADSNLSYGYAHACLFDSTGSGANMDLGTLGGDYSLALAINNNSQIVGWAYDSSSEAHACLFDKTGGGANINLGALGGIESVAFSINDKGQIVGWADIDLVYQHACLFDNTGGGANIDLNTIIDPCSGWTLLEALSINNNGWIVGYGYNPQGDIRAFLLILDLVDYPDLMTFAEQWLMSGQGLSADLYHDEKVDFKDFAVFADYWFDYCPSGWNL